MKQYIDLINSIKEFGTYKPAARENMPGTQSLFGYQYRHDLAKGFPILTTKKVFWSGLKTELLWFLSGSTNIKYLVDNGVNFWSQDAYNYYIKKAKEQGLSRTISFELFENFIKNAKDINELKNDSINNSNQGIDTDLVPKNYVLGDCGYQYGKVWRKWDGKSELNREGHFMSIPKIDQIVHVINQLKKSPEGRRHIVTAVDPANDENLALYWCHAFFQFNCRPLTLEQKIELLNRNGATWNVPVEDWNPIFAKWKIPNYYLDCQLYQRSADSFLGVPLNIASYALLTHLMAKICNMIPGHFIHTFGDVHIYDNHMDAVAEQLTREPKELPTLIFSENFESKLKEYNNDSITFDDFIHSLTTKDFTLDGYNPHPAIKAELSTGMKK